ncbi:copper homeostasis protein CutC [Streptomyces sp. MUM 16J]|nr:copper homeostasis protein CutC [Streptomyces sp. MUM 16J]
MVHTPLALEISVASAAGARVARDGGAGRVELCSALEVGGITPSQALVEAVSAVGLPVHALVRCRPGDFVYDADEIALMAAEVRSVLAAGAQGVVIGALTEAGALDMEAMHRLIEAAHGAATAAGRPAELTLHRAIDQAADPVGTAELVPTLGLTRILTSGGALTALDGIATIADIVAAAPCIEVMAGAGVRPSDVSRLAAAGIAAVHLSAKRRAPARRGGGWVPMGIAGSSATADTHFVTDPRVVAAARAAVDAVDSALPRPGPGPGPRSRSGGAGPTSPGAVRGTDPPAGVHRRPGLRPLS